MPKVINNTIKQERSPEIEAGMLFKTANDNITMVVRAGGGFYLIDLSDGIEWDDCDLSDMTVEEVEEDNNMTLLNVQSITIQ